MLAALMFFNSTKVVRALRWPSVILSTLLFLIAAPLGSAIGTSIEEYNMRGLSGTGRWTWEKAREGTWDWSVYFGWGLVAIFGVSCLFDWYVFFFYKEGKD